ncbi:hypothetical protein JW707_04855, partial [Candidatus Woesearchaeota archaeon]|nr:hypothetical protein [Candidatus Woesearchaeota archaeon]
ICYQARRVVAEVGKKFGIDFEFIDSDMGGVSFDKSTAHMTPEEKEAINGWSDEDKTQLSFPQETRELMDMVRDEKGAVLFGAVGRPDLPKRLAELGLLGMRKRYNANNNRPFIIDPLLAHNSTLYRNPVHVPGIEIVSPEESLFSGDYEIGPNLSWTRKGFSRAKLEKTVQDAFEKAMGTGKKILCASKFNVLISEEMLSNVFEQYAQEYAGRVTLNEHTNTDKEGNITGQLIIDNAGMQFAAYPERYANTVVVADAMFGGFLQTIIDVVTGSKPVSEGAKKRMQEEGIKRVFIRELCGGLYFGPRDKSNPEFIYDTMEYDAKTVRDLAAVARKVNAQLGLSTIDSLEIAGVPTFDFWGRILDEDAAENRYNLKHYKQQDGVAELMTNPYMLGTLIASNMSGDIFTDLAAAVGGKTLGMFPSSEINADGFGNYQQIAGSAPSLAGKNIANPIAEIRSAAMMLEDFGYADAAKMVNDAVTAALHKVRTADIWEEGYQKVSTSEMGDFIVQYIKEAA